MSLHLQSPTPSTTGEAAGAVSQEAPVLDTGTYGQAAVDHLRTFHAFMLEGFGIFYVAALALAAIWCLLWLTQRARGASRTRARRKAAAARARRRGGSGRVRRVA